MVYCGKPSRGCQNCKTRRIKCDEVRPTCTQCRKSNRTCPGYPDEFDLIFRNETAAVRRRAQRAVSSASNKSHPKPPPIRDTSTSPTAPALIWETYTTHDSPRSEKLEWFDDNCSPVRRCTSPPRSSPHEYQPQQPEILVFDSNYNTPAVSPIAIAYPDAELTGKALVGAKSSIPPSLDSSGLRMNYAVAFFFKHVVGMPRSNDSMRGYVELLGPMYVKAKSDSVLHLATHALALASLSNGRKSPLLRIEARRLYGKALQTVGSSIRDPVEVRSDEVLMSIMLFSLYEAITSTDDSRTVWTRHINGAVTLVKLRGEKQLKSSTSLRLFRAVRASMLTASIQQGKFVEDFPSPNSWKCDESFGVNAANRLTLICLNLPNIKIYAQDLLNSNDRNAKVAEVMKILHDARDLDSQLEQWASTLPDFWEPRMKMLCQEQAEDLKNAQFWPGPVHTYGDLSIANVWNDYRVSRIFCQSVILGCLLGLPPHARTEQIERISEQAIYVTQQMVDGFCSAIPYLLGFDFESRNQPPQDEASAKATGAYFAVWPLFVTKKLPTIPDDQKFWLLHRLYHIGETFGLTGPEVLHMANMHVLTSGPDFSYGDNRRK